MAKESASVLVCASGDVTRERRIAQPVIARLRQEHGDKFEIVDGEWNFDFQDCSMDPADVDAAIFIFGRRLTASDNGHELYDLTHNTAISDIEWQFERTMIATKRSKRPQVFVFRKGYVPSVPMIPSVFEHVRQQIENQDRFWKQWFLDETGQFKLVFHPIESPEKFELLVESALRQALNLPRGGRRKVAFVSHASEDIRRVNEIVAKIEQGGIKCWMAHRDVSPGKNYQDEIVDVLENAKAIVLIFSSAANKSDEILKELSIASSLGLLVVPVRIDETEPERGFRYELANRQFIDISGNRFGDISQVIAALKAHFEDRIRPVSLR
jgi:hypothetical protein